MIRRRDCGHFVAVDGVEGKEILDLGGNIRRGEVSPNIKQFGEHGHRPTEQYFAQVAVHTELLVTHAHVLFVRL